MEWKDAVTINMILKSVLLYLRSGRPFLYLWSSVLPLYDGWRPSRMAGTLLMGWELYSREVGTSLEDGRYPSAMIGTLWRWQVSFRDGWHPATVICTGLSLPGRHGCHGCLLRRPTSCPGSGVLQHATCVGGEGDVWCCSSREPANLPF